MVYDVNIMKLLYDCLDAMRVSRDDADELLRDLSSQLPEVISGLVKKIEKLHCNNTSRRSRTLHLRLVSNCRN
jgi:hypothetical protein